MRLLRISSLAVGDARNDSFLRQANQYNCKKFFNLVKIILTPFFAFSCNYFEIFPCIIFLNVVYYKKVALRGHFLFLLVQTFCSSGGNNGGRVNRGF